MEKLKKYNSKRNFNKTSEPKGKTKTSKTKSLKFIIQHHLARRDHYDFRLEWDGVLISWAVPKGPSFNPKDKRLAVKVEDHPLDYANFEGVIPKGEYGGGTVQLWDKGTWGPTIDNFDDGLKKGSIKINIKGKRLKGNWALVRLKGKNNEEDDNWLLIKEKDEFANSKLSVADFVDSVKTGRTTNDIKKEESLLKLLPIKITNVELATLVDRIPNGDNWAYEIKYDGYRILTYLENNKATLFTRNKMDYTNKFSSVANSIEKSFKGKNFVLDGEMVVLDDAGKSDFQSLQNFVKHQEGGNLSYMVFDILALNGKDLRNKTLIERKEILKKLLSNAPNNVVYSEHIIGHGQRFYNEAFKLGLEGVIGKRVDSKYLGTRGGDWIKKKCYKMQEFVVGGYTLTNKKSSGISALLLGVYEKGEFVFIGKAGTGIDSKEQAELNKLFKNLTCKKPYFKNPPKTKSTETYFWLKPKVVVEIQFAEITKEKLLRQASYKGVRKDKEEKDVVLEKPKQIKKTSEDNNKDVVCGVEISNPNKIIFESKKVKKIDVVNYYNEVSSRMLPYVLNRVLSVVRCHKGVKSDCFFKKHPNTKSEGVKVVDITNSDGKTEEYFCIDKKTGLISEAQNGTIEFHVWGSTINKLEKPDMMVFDLDPDKGMGLSQIRQGVKHLKKILDNLGLKSFLKTSGGKGYHVVVPINPSINWQNFHDFAKNVAILMETKWPNLYTSNIRLNNRKGKIFIDWARNGRGSTSVAPYSLRSRVGAKVSMPISWSELDKVAPNDIDIFDALERIKKRDPWANFFKTNQELKI